MLTWLKRLFRRRPDREIYHVSIHFAWTNWNYGLMKGYFLPHPKPGDLVASPTVEKLVVVSEMLEIFPSEELPELFHAKCRHVGYYSDAAVAELLKQTSGGRGVKTDGLHLPDKAKSRAEALLPPTIGACE